MNKKPDIITFPALLDDSFSPVITEQGAIAAERRLFEVHPKSRQVKILKALAKSKDGILHKEQLVPMIYDDLFDDAPATSMIRVSKRYLSAVKTMSRLRLELEHFFGDLTPPGFQWLPWSDKLYGWVLFSQGSMSYARC
jgi:hypothetical protein